MQLESQNHPSLADMLHLKQLMLDGFIKCTRSVLESSSFEKTARIIFDTCRELTGATAGYVALLNDAGTENEVLFLESGGLPCTVAPDLPMPIRGLRAEAYRSCKAVYHNDFMQSPWVKYMPHGHVVLHSCSRGKQWGSSALLTKKVALPNRMLPLPVHLAK